MAVCGCIVLPSGEEMAAGSTTGGRLAGGGSVLLWAVFCWETLGSGLHADVPLTHTTSLEIVADHVHPFMARVFLDGSGLFQQDNGPCPLPKRFRNGLRNMTFLEVLPWPPNSPDLSPMEHLWDVLELQI